MPEYIIDTAQMDIDRKKEIVRCRDCVKLKRVRETGVFGKCTNRVIGEYYVRPDDYCAWGERKDGSDA